MYDYIHACVRVLYTPMYLNLIFLNKKWKVEEEHCVIDHK